MARKFPFNVKYILDFIFLKIGYVSVRSLQSPEQIALSKPYAIRSRKFVDKWQYASHSLDAVAIEQIRISMANEILNTAIVFISFDQAEKNGVCEFNAALWIYDSSNLKKSV